MTREELEEVIYERTRDFAEVRVMDCILELIAAEREAEREACAKVCDDTDVVRFWHGGTEYDDANRTMGNAAAAIRARGSK
jgi:hypothetical protein